MEKQLKIALQRTFVRNFNFEIINAMPEEGTEIETEVKINLSVNTNNVMKDHYVIIFDCSLKNPAFNLNVEFIAAFSASEEIDENFLNSSFVQVNSPAIAFPYLRSFITTFTANAGIPAFILPAYNFTT